MRQSFAPVVLLACVVATVNAQESRSRGNAAQSYRQQQAITPAVQAGQQAVQPQAGQPVAPASTSNGTSLKEGAILTRRAQAAANPADRQQAILQAEGIYTRALEANPGDGKVLNNLAVVAVNKGDAAAARGYFERAIAANDAHKGYYALNYSKFLQASDKPAAVNAARMAVNAAPDSVAANVQLGALLWETNPAEMLPLARDLVARGHTELATQFALQCLTSPSRPTQERRAWLVLLASRLANEYALSATVRESIATDLARLEGDPEIGAGARQLRAVIESPPSTPADVAWWRGQSGGLPGQAVSVRAAMRNVLLAAGEFNFSRDSARAERYLTPAIELGDHGPDPDAFLRLVELYTTNSGKQGGAEATQALARLMDRYQYELFTEKGAAYMRADWPLIYRMHVALGMTYAYLNTWRSPVEYQNAVFQLSHAMRAAEQANRQTPRTNDTKLLALPAVGVEKLAQGYEATGRKDLALKARIDGAAALRAADYLQDSQDVFRAIPTTDVPSLDAPSRERYEALRKEFQRAR